MRTETGKQRTGPSRRVRSLDGLRGLALLAVLGYHAAPSQVRGGFLGVEAFFVLSGFLLTALLLEEARRTGAIDRKGYAGRRLRRIVPALIVFLLGLEILGPLAAPEDAYRLRGDVLWSLAGLTNWHLIQDGASYFSQIGRPPLVRHLWSIAVEIQFYLLCPFLVGWLVRKRRFTAVAVTAGGIAASALLMGLHYRSPDPSRAYYGTDTRMSALLAGVLLAVLLGHRISKPARRKAGGVLQRFGMAAMGVLGLLVIFAGESSRAMYPLGFLLTQGATMVVITASLKRGPVASFLNRPALRWLGRRCYGIYLWHWPAVALLRPGVDVSWPRPATAALSILIAVALGALSFRLVEQPWLRPRKARHLAPRRTHPVLKPAAACLAVAPVMALTVRLPTSNPIAESLEAGQRVLAKQSALVSSRKSKAPLLLTPITAGGSLLAAPGAAAVPPQPVGFPVTAIGDSVMVGAAGALQERLGPAVFIDAKLRRHFKEGIQIARTLREQGKRGEVVVVHLGNNGPVKPSQMDQLMAELAGVRNVLLVNVRVGKQWSDSVNQTYAEAAGRHPSLRVVNWFGLTAEHAEWFHSDGSHLKPAGARAYAELIANSLAALPPPPPPAPPAPAAPADPPTILLR